jgi:hypothetical protein
MSKFCIECGVENLDDAKFCKSCGKELDEVSDRSAQPQIKEKIVVSKISGKAIASLVLSILWVYGIGSILAIIFGHLARKEIKNSDGRLSGEGIALAGLIIGYALLSIIVVGIIAAVLIPKAASGQ